MLLIDEIDSLSGDSLLAVLQQVRAGYYLRPQRFPQSIVLCGLRDVRDYRTGAGGSPFNIKAESLRLGDFSRDEVATLFGQHTAETGQEFSPEALDAVWSRTRCQPWLVNALGREACFRSKVGRDRSRRIVADDFADVQERLILRRETHLDQLADKLKQERVRRVIEPLLSGGDDFEFSERDVEYVRDLGLIAADDPLRIANPIYAEVVPRELTAAAQTRITHEQAWYVDADGRLDLGKLLTAFQAFFRRHSESWVERLEYKEAGPQLLLQAFLQRIVSGGGRVEREYGLGRGAHRPVGGLAAGRDQPPPRDRVQDPLRELEGDHQRGFGADSAVHGAMRGGRWPFGDLRPQHKPRLGREGVPEPPAGDDGRLDRRLGNVTGALSARRWIRRVRVGDRLPCLATSLSQAPVARLRTAERALHPRLVPSKLLLRSMQVLFAWAVA